MQNPTIVFVENFNNIDEDLPAENFLKLVQNFELNIVLTKFATELAAIEYFKDISEHLKNERLTHITLTNTNKIFKPRPESGFKVNEFNKQFSGSFKYLMPLKGISNETMAISSE